MVNYQKVEIAGTPTVTLSSPYVRQPYLANGSVANGASITIQPAVNQFMAFQVFVNEKDGNVAIQVTSDGGANWYTVGYAGFAFSGGIDPANAVTGAATINGQVTFYATNSTYYRILNNAGSNRNYLVNGLTWY